MEFSRPEYWSGQPIPSPSDLPNPGIETGSPALQENFFTSCATIPILCWTFEKVEGLGDG